MKNRKLVCGVGINDADYSVTFNSKISGVNKQDGMCPFYRAWKNMLVRCYTDAYPCYKGCVVCDEWLYFSSFRAWMSEQEWEGNQLDKDLLVPGCKIYSPDTCVFVSKRVNCFLTENKRRKEELPAGVSRLKGSEKFAGRYLNRHLGSFSTVEEAHAAWKHAKLEDATSIFSELKDSRVKEAILSRYSN